MTTTKRPNPDRVYAVVNTILQRRYDVKIKYTILHIEGGQHEQHQDHCRAES